jgi:hypothetical protein
MPYRDDLASLEARRDELRRDLADINKKAEALAEAVRDKDAVARELAAVEARIERIPSRRLPLLDSVKIASPCSASWDDMIGDERARFCAHCQKNVYNLSAMASEEAERLLREHEGSLCVRLYRRADGKVMTTDCPVGLKRKRLKIAAVSALGAGAMALTAFMSLWRSRGSVAMMGEMAPISPAPVETTTPARVMTGATAWTQGTSMPSESPAPPTPPQNQKLPANQKSPKPKAETGMY